MTAKQEFKVRSQCSYGRRADKSRVGEPGGKSRNLSARPFTIWVQNLPFRPLHCLVYSSQTPLKFASPGPCPTSSCPSQDQALATSPAPLPALDPAPPCLGPAHPPPCPITGLPPSSAEGHAPFPAPRPFPLPLGGGARHLLPAPPCLTARWVRRSTPRLAPGAKRCFRTAVPRRSSCSASSRCRRCWYWPRPPAAAWPGDSALCCPLPRGPPNSAAPRGPATRAWHQPIPMRRTSSAPGCNAPEASKSREAPGVTPIKESPRDELWVPRGTKAASELHAQGSE